MTTWPDSAHCEDDSDDSCRLPVPGEASGDPRIGAQGPDEQSVPMQGEQPRLTVAAVARRLGVAPATLRTWDRRYGLGPSDHTSGSHRRYGPGDVARLEQMQRALLRGASPAEAARFARSSPGSAPQRYPDQAGQAQAESPPEPLMISGVLGTPDDEAIETSTYSGGGGLKLSGSGPRARGLGRAALALDSWSAQRLLVESVEADGVAVTWRDVLRPVLRAIIDRRHRSGSGTEALQLLLDCSSTAFRALMATAPPPLNPRPVLLASVPGEGQELELVALAAGLATKQVGHRLFGAALPKEGLDAAILRAAPAAVVLWAEQTNYAAPELIGEIPATRQRARAFAAGPGWDPATLPEHVELLGSLEIALERLPETVLG